MNEPVLTGNNEMGDGNCLTERIDYSYNKNEQHDRNGGNHELYYLLCAYYDHTDLGSISRERYV